VTTSRKYQRVYLLLVLVALMGINILGTFFHARIDLTDEERFTLSPGTITVLKNIREPIHVTVYLKGKYPSGFRKLSETTADLLEEFQLDASKRLTIEFVEPETAINDTLTIGDSLSSAGFLPINLTAQVKQGQQQLLVYPYAKIHYRDRQEMVVLYKGKTPLHNNRVLNEAESMLEYQFASAIARIQQDEKPLIGYAIGHGEPMDLRVYDLAEEALQPNYRLQLINLAEQPLIPLEFKALLMVKPTTHFRDIDKLKIDQYIMQGGKPLFFLDRLEAEMDSLQIINRVLAYDRDLQLQDQLFRYGVRVNPNLLMDLQSDFLPFDVNGNGQYEFLPWNYFPLMESSNNHPINKNMGYVAGRFVNTLDTVSAPGIQKTILLTSSSNARTLSAPALISGSENVIAPEDANYNKKALPTAVLLEGKFRSFFANRLSEELSDSLKANGMNFFSICNNNTAMLVAGDGDLVLNSITRGNQPLPMGMNPYTFGTQREFPFANKEFLLNTLEYLVNDQGLSEAKNKEYKLRLIDTKKANAEKTYWQVFNLILPIGLMWVFGFIFLAIRRRNFK
jgi:ABC-2 type transport system permease protein